ncbi:cystatin-B-like [Pagrus major]|uniref:cystatin-B-like n=1 Tax=Pagrus major TaxID=143350 RepID=UPI003CC8CF33
MAYICGMVGGHSDVCEATDEIQKICDQVKDETFSFTNEKYKEFRATKYKQQVVAGKNFLIKVHVGGDNYIHMSVFQGLPCYGGRVQLTGVEKDKKADDPLEHLKPPEQCQVLSATMLS